MISAIIGGMIFAVPAAAILFFAISLGRYISARVKKKKAPDSIDKNEISLRLAMLIVSSVIVGVLVLAVICYALLVAMIMISM